MPLRALVLRLGLTRVQPADLDGWEREQEVPRLAHVALSDPRRGIRLRAVEALARLSCRTSVQTLRRALNDRARIVSLAAASGLHAHDRQAAEATRTWWQEHDVASAPTYRQLVDPSKMERFAAFKKQVLAQASKGRFYG